MVNKNVSISPGRPLTSAPIPSIRRSESPPTTVVVCSEIICARVLNSSLSWGKKRPNSPENQSLKLPAAGKNEDS